MKCRCPQCQTVVTVSSELAGKKLQCRSCQSVFQAPPWKSQPRGLTPPEDEVDSTPLEVEPHLVEDWIKELNRDPKSKPPKPLAPREVKRPAILVLASWLWGMAMVSYLSAAATLIVILNSLSEIKDKDGLVIFVALSPVGGLLFGATFTLALSEGLRLMVRCEEYLRTIAESRAG